MSHLSSKFFLCEDSTWFLQKIGILGVFNMGEGKLKQAWVSSFKQGPGINLDQVRVRIFLSELVTQAAVPC